MKETTITTNEKEYIEAMLNSGYGSAEAGDSIPYWDIETKSKHNEASLKGIAGSLVKKGIIENVADEEFAFTEKGLAIALESEEEKEEETMIVSETVIKTVVKGMEKLNVGKMPLAGKSASEIQEDIYDMNIATYSQLFIIIEAVSGERDFYKQSEILVSAYVTYCNSQTQKEAEAIQAIAEEMKAQNLSTDMDIIEEYLNGTMKAEKEVCTVLVNSYPQSQGACFMWLLEEAYKAYKALNHTPAGTPAGEKEAVTVFHGGQALNHDMVSKKGYYNDSCNGGNIGFYVTTEKEVAERYGKVYQYTFTPAKELNSVLIKISDLFEIINITGYWDNFSEHQQEGTRLAIDSWLSYDNYDIMLDLINATSQTEAVINWVVSLGISHVIPADSELNEIIIFDTKTLM